MKGLALLLTIGCGPQAAIFLKIEAPLVVPADCDAVQVTAARGAAGGASIFDHTYDLGGKPFPHTLTLTTANPADLDGAGVTVTVSALKSGSLARSWAHASAATTLLKGNLSPLTVKLCECP